MAVARFGSGDKIPRQRRFLTSGTWTVPAGVKWVKARIVGGGATGRLAINNSNVNPDPISGTGGGQVVDAILAVTPGSSMTVSVATQSAAPIYTGNQLTATTGGYSVNGNSSSFAGITAAGGVLDFGVPSGLNAGIGAAVPGISPSNNGAVPMLNFSGTSGPDGYGAGSGAVAAFNGNAYPTYVSPGPGGVRASVVFGSGGNFNGVDAPFNTGAAGGGMTIATSGLAASGRAGYGGSGIVILDWEEYA